MVIEGIFNGEKKERLTFNFSIEDLSKNIGIFLEKGPDDHFPVTLKDPIGNIRILTTLKSKERVFYSGENFSASSNCSMPGELYDGIWELEIIRTYESNEGFRIKILQDIDVDLDNEYIEIREVRYNKIYNNERRWYKGEMHAHTRYSDGLLPLKTLPEAIKNYNLDFMFLTDHNIVTTKMPIASAPIIPSTELTLMENGHFNFLGLRSILDYKNLIQDEDIDPKSLKRMFKWVKSQGGLVVMNHPLNKTMGVDYNIDLEDFDLIEVLNSSYNKDKIEFNIKALKAFDKLLLNGHKIFAVGGSDSHSDFENKETSNFGKPLNYVHMDEFTINNLFEALKIGKTYISNIGEIDFKIENDKKEVFPGEKTDKNIVTYEIKSDIEVNWKFIVNGKVEREIFGNDINYTITLPKDSYVRVEGEVNFNIVAVINPIFYGEIEKTEKKWMDMRKEDI